MPYLSVRQVAAELGLARMTIYRAIYAGRLTSIRFGSAHRISQEALTAFVQSQQKEPSRRRRTPGNAAPTAAETEA